MQPGADGRTAAPDRRTGLRQVGTGRPATRYLEVLLVRGQPGSGLMAGCWPNTRMRVNRQTTRSVSGLPIDPHSPEASSLLRPRIRVETKVAVRCIRRYPPRCQGVPVPAAG